MLAWDVSADPNISLAQVEANLVQGGEFISPADLRLQFPDWEETWVEWTSTLNPSEVHADMQESVRDGDSYRMWSPTTAERYGCEYVGLGADKPFDAEFEFRGRGGKHLCVTKFEGVPLTGRLAEMMLDTWIFDTTTVRHLMGMMDEWDRCFSRQAVYDEYRYQLAWRFADTLRANE